MTQLLTAFHDPNKKEATQQRLKQLKQGTKPATEFFVEFEENKSLAGYNNERVYHIAQKEFIITGT